MKNRTRRAIGKKAACIALTAAICSTFIAGNVLAFADGGKRAAAEAQSLSFENVTGNVNLDGIKLSNMSSKVLENEQVNLNQKRTVIVSLKGECLAEQTDDVKDFVTTAAGTAARKRIANEQTKFLNELKSEGIDYTLAGSYDTVINAVAIEVNLQNLTKIKKLNGVATVSVSTTYAYPKSAEGETGAQINSSKIYANGIYDSSEIIKNTGYDGSGMTVAILDTGIDYTHEAFADDVASPRFTRDHIENAVANGGFQAQGNVYVSSKVPFAYDYADKDDDVYPSYSQHGTHVAGIVGGKADSYTDKDGYVAKDEEGNVLSFRGVAPESQLVICKVFTDNIDDKDLGGAETYDILHALEDCCLLGVDVINMSLGTSSGFSSASLGLTEADSEGKWLNEVYLRIRGQGISLMVAASNEFSSGYGSAFGTNLASNPDSGTVGSPSTFAGAMSVASINGQRASYILANPTVEGNSVTGGDAIYYEESRNEDSDAYNFVNQMLGDPEKDETYVNSATFKYVIVPGTGEATDYTRTVKNALDDKKEGEKVIAVVERGISSFKDKIETAKTNHADAVIVYNNVSGMIRMSLGDMEDPLPSIFVSMDSGILLKKAGSTGKIVINRKYEAGPFMNDYSSWGTTPDLKLKPDVTSHGGEITSTVAGGYDEMSGTSMACPNLAGFTALLRGYLKNEKSALYTDAITLTNLTNNVMMSTATVVYDRSGLPYSPRKQGSGLATLANAFSTNAYLYTKNTTNYTTNVTDVTDPECMCEDGRPKAELGDGTSGVYDIVFYARNIGTAPLTFKAKTLFFTETLGADGKSVAEQAHLFESSTSAWKVNGSAVAEGASFTVAANSVAKVEVKLTMGEKDKQYITKNFVNGMFAEGFLQLISATEGQCDLSFPFMAFYGDWSKAPLLDMDCFKQAEYDKDTSLNERTRPQPNVWASQAYSYYYNEKYATPLGSYLYVQDEDKEHTADYVYTDMEHIAISCYNDYNGEDATDNYMTVTGIKALYAGLLRNAEIVTYRLSNKDTGEIICDEYGNADREIYRVSKAMAAGGSPIPANVLLELRSQDLGLAANGKYELSFKFYFKYADYKEGTDKYETFDMTFYIDYEAPVLVDSRLRYQDMKDSNGKESQKVYLDLDVFDNTYPQCVILCYSTTGNADEASLKLATEYITPIINPKKNTTTTVSIDITDIYEDYKGKLFVEVDDYALNHNVYALELDHMQTANGSSEFKIAQGGSITIDKNSAKKLSLENAGNSNLSNYIWRSSDTSVVKVKNGELFGVSAGTAYVTALGGNGHTEKIAVTVKDSSKRLSTPTLSFGTIFNDDDVPELAAGMVEVNPAQKFTLNIIPDPWYFPLEELGGFTWSSGDDSIATVDENGNVTIVCEEDRTKTVRIVATAKSDSKLTASVTLSVRTPYIVSNNVLTRYRGWGGSMTERVQTLTLGDKNGESYTLTNVRVLTIPTDKAITSIGKEAFKENTNVEVVIIPKNVTSIDEDAFKDCTSLKAVAFISPEKTETPADSSLTMLHRGAFKGCTSLEVVDFSNCKVFTLDKNVFTGCTGLKKVINLTIVGTMYANTFAGCTSLESVNLSSLHVAGDSIFAGCTSLASVTTSANTALGTNMFAGCTSLTQVDIKCKNVPANCFNRCSSLESVTLAEGSSIGAGAFAGCSKLQNINLSAADYIGNEAFRSCVKLSLTTSPLKAGVTLGNDAFAFVSGAGEVVEGGKLVLAAKVVTSLPTVTEIGEYAFSGSVLSGIDTLDLSGVTKLGKGAFANLRGLKTVVLPEGIEEIPDYCFSGTGLTSITLPASVTKIGEGAFANCTALESVSFNGVEKIGARAFSGAGLTSVNLPASVVEVGDGAFENCENLKSATLAAVKKMGEGVFAFSYNLTTAVFGDECTSTGVYTFFCPDLQTGAPVGKLASVTLGNGIKEISKGAFAYCGSLTEINLNKATRIAEEAFYECRSLKTVTGLEKVTGVTRNERVLNDKFILVDKDVYYPAIGSYAFAYCNSLTSANLSAADTIDHSAFFMCTSLASITLGANLEQIGDNAFAETALTAINLPAKVTYVGTSAFSGIKKLTSIGVAAGNKNYFSADGVLYRNIGEGSYELCAYPLGKGATRTDGVATYTVLDGTVSIGAFAFYGVPANKITKIVLPYTLKLIGNGAFLQCGATSYEFHSIAAPVLLEGLSDRIIENDFSVNSFMYNNFGYVAYMAAHKPGGTAEVASTLTIVSASNGTGYDNLIYRSYFTSRVSAGELPEDDARTLKAMLEGMSAADDVAGWTTSNKTKAEVEAFAAEVIEAHAIYNTLSSEYQRKYVGEENIAKLFAVEQSLKPVKAAFGISAKISLVSVDNQQSTHKTQYTEGEKFSLEGLKILITYDDYTTQTIDATGNFRLSYDRELWLSDSAVSLDGIGELAGRTVTIMVTVSEQGGSEEGGEGNGGDKGGLSVGAIVGIPAAAAAMAATAVALIFILKKKRAGANNEEGGEQPEATEETEEATEEGEVKENAEEKPAEEVKEEPEAPANEEKPVQAENTETEQAPATEETAQATEEAKPKKKTKKAKSDGAKEGNNDD